MRIGYSHDESWLLRRKEIGGAVGAVVEALNESSVDVAKSCNMQSRQLKLVTDRVAGLGIEGGWRDH